jgi:hypothetical protein
MIHLLKHSHETYCGKAKGEAQAEDEECTGCSYVFLDESDKCPNCEKEYNKEND